jgi:uncharacterized protein YkwD
MATRDNPCLIPVAASSAPFEIAADAVAIGSAPGNDLVVDDATVSRRHATLTRHDKRLWLTDLGATNGTYVNGSRISAPVYLNDGDELRLGAAIFRFAAGAPAQRRGYRAIPAIVALVLIFAAGFVVITHIANFSRLQDAADLPPLPSGATNGASPHAVASSATSPTASATAALELSSSIPPASTPIVSPSTVIDEANPATDRLWLDPLNRYRHSAGVGPVRANPRLSHGDYLHSRYIVKNFGERLAARENLGPEMHFEDPSKPWYSVEGAAAGRAGDVDEMWNPRKTAPPSWALDNWMQSPFHRLPILNPHLHSVGYSYFCEDAICIAALNLNSDVDPLLSAPARLATPIEYPPNGASIEMNSFDGEWPDPLASCPGYSLPAGYPITLQLGSMVNPGFASVSFKRTAPTSAVLDTCTFDGFSYRNPDPGTQKMMRFQLINFGAIVVMPRAPLTRGTYSIAVVAGGHDYSWSFSVER